MATTTKGRIKIPSHPEDVLNLGSAVYVKHQADGANSPLNGMEDNDWNVTGPKIATALDAHNEAERYKGLMEQYYRERDKYMPEVRGIVRNSAALLKARFSKNPKRLSDWGYTVDDTPPAAKNGTPQA